MWVPLVRTNRWGQTSRPDGVPRCDTGAAGPSSADSTYDLTELRPPHYRLGHGSRGTELKTYVVSGAASGIGAATTEVLRAQGDRVITIDLRDADVIADLSTPVGRADAVAAVQQLTDVVHGIVPCAGIAGSTGVDSALVV